MTGQLIFIFVPPTLNLKKSPINQLIKKFWPYQLYDVNIMSRTEFNWFYIIILLKLNHFNLIFYCGYLLSRMEFCF